MKVKYNVKGVESQGDFKPPKPGLYRLKLEEINDWKGGHGAGIEAVFSVVATSSGDKKVDGIGAKLWRYLYLDYEPTASMLREFLEAVGVVDGGKGETGTIDTAKLIGTEVLGRLKSDKNPETDEVRAKIGRLMPLGDAAEPEEPDDEAEPEDEPEAEGEPEGEEVDLDSLDRDELKALIKEEKLGTLADLGITKATTDEQIREIIAEKLGGEEPEPEEEEEPEAEPEPEEEPEPEGDDLADLDRDGLKKLIKTEDLGSLADLGINKATSDDEIRALIRSARGSEEPEDAAPDYDSWSPEQLKSEIQERGLSLEGRFAKSKAVKALKEDDASDSEPF